MQISEIESKKLLPQWAHAVDWIQAAFDAIVRAGAARIPAIDAPLTMDAIHALTDAELQEWYARFGVVQYYPDLSRETRERMLFWLARLYRFLGTPKSVEILCRYIHDGAPMSVVVRDNLAWNGTTLEDEALLDLFDVEIDAESSQITPLLAYRIAQNIYRIARNSQTLREIIYSYAAHIDIPTAAISEECGVMIGDSGIAQLPPMAYIVLNADTGAILGAAKGREVETVPVPACTLANPGLECVAIPARSLESPEMAVYVPDIPESIEVVLGLKWDNSAWKAVNVSNDFWWAGILSAEDQSRLASLGLVADYSPYPYKELFYDSTSYSYEFVALYSDMGETIIPTTASDFSVGNKQSAYGFVASIICTGSYGTLAKTWKCRITKLEGQQ